MSHIASVLPYRLGNVSNSSIESQFSITNSFSTDTRVRRNARKTLGARRFTPLWVTSELKCWIIILHHESFCAFVSINSNSAHIIPTAVKTPGKDSGMKKSGWSSFRSYFRQIGLLLGLILEFNSNFTSIPATLSYRSLSGGKSRKKI